MCEPLLPIEELEKLKWAVSSLAALGAEPGTHEKENRHNAADGIRSRLDWCIRQLNGAGEGRRNMGA